MKYTEKGEQVGAEVKRETRGSRMRKGRHEAEGAWEDRMK